MARAIFHRPFDFDRRPRQAMAFHVPAGEIPQSWPRDVVQAAVTAGAATEVKDAPSLHRRRRTTTKLFGRQPAAEQEGDH